MNITNRILIGDALQVLKTLPDNSIQMCCSSPPYYSLRDYQVDGQIGLESSPDEFIAKLVEVFREVKRVLRNDGTLWVNIGDSYSSGSNNPSPKHSSPNVGKSRRVSELGPKQLLGIPWLLAFALRANGWYLRQDIIWAKPNCMPESVKDRPTKSHEYLFLLSKSERYYYDADAIREPHSEHTLVAYPYGAGGREEYRQSIPGQTKQNGLKDAMPNLAGRNKRSVWTVATTPFSAASLGISTTDHFATFPPKLIEPCILAGSRPGDIVLDPFCGAGTVPLVAIKHGRSYLGIELNPEYVALAERRIATVQQDLWSVAGENEVAL